MIKYDSSSAPVNLVDWSYFFEISPSYCKITFCEITSSADPKLYMETTLPFTISVIPDEPMGKDYLNVDVECTNVAGDKMKYVNWEVI